MSPGSVDEPWTIHTRAHTFPLIIEARIHSSVDFACSRSRLNDASDIAGHRWRAVAPTLARVNDRFVFLVLAIFAVDKRGNCESSSWWTGWIISIWVIWSKKQDLSFCLLIQLISISRLARLNIKEENSRNLFFICAIFRIISSAF